MPQPVKSPTSAATDMQVQRTRMLEEQLRARGIHDQRVLAAFARVPRERFVGDKFRDKAYEDGPLPIGHEQTISQPLIVAIMIGLLEVQASDRVLEVGTGTGYQAAILGELAEEVWTIERHGALAIQAREILQELGYSNICVVTGDGSLGLPGRSPFNKIIVAAGAPQVPPSLVAQLAEGGSLVAPIGDKAQQQIVLVRKIGSDVVTTSHSLCSFVPLIGTQGWEQS